MSSQRQFHANLLVLQASPSIQGEFPGHIGQEGDSEIGQVATVALGQVTRGGRGRGCYSPAEARGDEEGAGVSGEVYRVRGIVETYDAAKHPLVYEQRVRRAGLLAFSHRARAMVVKRCRCGGGNGG